ncbi:MAG: hypothetical protein HY011_29805 [Acidobacteria bacterium]|nr:hypothetical protein [Acidobacteriota bacterium]
MLGLLHADAAEPQAVADLRRALAKKRPQDGKPNRPNQQPDQPIFLPLGLLGYAQVTLVYGKGVLQLAGGESRGSGNWGPVVEWVPGAFGFGLQGGGRQEVPTIRGTTDKGKIKDFNNAIAEATSRLNSDDCAKLFGGKDAALGALYGARYSYQDLSQATQDPNTGAVSAVGAATYRNTNPPAVYINNYGPFRNTSVLVRGSSGVKSHTFDFGTGLRGAQFGALLLLHELGHLVGIFGSDAGDSKLNRGYTQQVQDACFPKKQ